MTRYYLTIHLHASNPMESMKELLEIYEKYGGGHDECDDALGNICFYDNTLYWKGQDKISALSFGIRHFTAYARRNMKKELTELGYEWCMERKYEK